MTTTADYQTITPEEKESAELIAILLIVAQSLERNRKTAGLPLHEAIAVAIETQGNLLALADRLYPEGGQMERQVTAFASRLGFDLTQAYVPMSSNAIH